jgi:hypothetical protein
LAEVFLAKILMPEKDSLFQFFREISGLKAFNTKNTKCLRNRCVEALLATEDRKTPLPCPACPVLSLEVKRERADIAATAVEL